MTRSVVYVRISADAVAFMQLLLMVQTTQLPFVSISISCAKHEFSAFILRHPYFIRVYDMEFALGAK